MPTWIDPGRFWATRCNPQPGFPAAQRQIRVEKALRLETEVGPMQVLTSGVARKNATIVLSQGNRMPLWDFTGWCAWTARPTECGGSRSKRHDTEIVPYSCFGMTVDYEYVAISDATICYPSSSLMLKRTRQKTELNEITFRTPTVCLADEGEDGPWGPASFKAVPRSKILPREIARPAAKRSKLRD